MRILLIEDKKKTAGFLAKGLREDGLTVEIAHDGESGLELARTKKFDLLIVDVMLPNKDGWTVVTELRKSGMRTPILFLTARDSVRDRVKGLELGADDYLVKPFAFSELMARVHSLLRRAPIPLGSLFVVPRHTVAFFVHLPHHRLAMPVARLRLRQQFLEGRREA